MTSVSILNPEQAVCLMTMKLRLNLRPISNMSPIEVMIIDYKRKRKRKEKRINKNNSIIRACEQGNYERLVKLHQKCKLELDRSCINIVCKSIKSSHNNYYKILQYLIKNGAYIDEEAILSAVTWSINEDIIRYLIIKNAPIPKNHIVKHFTLVDNVRQISVAPIEIYLKKFTESLLNYYYLPNIPIEIEHIIASYIFY